MENNEQENTPEYQALIEWGVKMIQRSLDDPCSHPFVCIGVPETNVECSDTSKK